MKKKIRKIKSKKGFSLVELLAVVVILGLIAAIGISATSYLSDLAKKNKKNFEVVRYNPTIDKGLNSLQLKGRYDEKLTNKTKQGSGKSFFRILFDNIVLNLIYSQ